MHCIKCGTEVIQDAKYCFKCGELIPIIATPNEISEPNDTSKENTNLITPPTTLPIQSKLLSGDNTNHAVISEDISQKGPSGVGGWLSFLVVSMIVIGPLIGANRLIVNFFEAEQQYSNLVLVHNWNNFKYLTWLVFAIFSGISIYGGWCLAFKRDFSTVKRVKIILWLNGPVASVVFGLIIPFMTLGSTAINFPEFIGGLIASVIAAGIWTIYLSKSKRVYNTYCVQSTQKNSQNDQHNFNQGADTIN